jgi:transcriptional regulator with XRE-family HTH domain
MARSKAIPDDLKAFRNKQGMTQAPFWNRFGTTQSGGSRYESGREMPDPLKMLFWLRHNDRISDDDLKDALKAIKPA